MILVIVGMRTEKHSLRSQVGIGSESDCLLGQLERILDISDLVAGLKVEESGDGAGGGGGECGETGVELFTRERRSSDILKKEAKLSASELADVKVGQGVISVVLYTLTICGSTLINILSIVFYFSVHFNTNANVFVT